MRVIEVNLDKSPYKVLHTDIQSGIQTILTENLNGGKIAIISDDNAAKHNLDSLKKILSSYSIEIIEIILSPGEKNKEIKVAENIIDKLLSEKFERRDLIIGLGGGVIGDLSGFIAGILHRGVKFINIPTTLLAQVDSSIGGKTGVNTKYGKNLIGCFKQPELVICDINSLSTLSKRDLLAGYSELVKHALIGDIELFSFLQSNNENIFNNFDLLQEAIYRSALVKANIVMEDTHEKGIRAYLNLGHTYGHAIESYFKYDGSLLHGEAISIGIIMAFKTSLRLNLCSSDHLRVVEDHFNKIGLMSNITSLKEEKIGPEEIIDLMRSDKKVTNGLINLVLPREIGSVEIRNDVDESIILDVIHETLDQ